MTIKRHSHVIKIKRDIHIFKTAENNMNTNSNRNEAEKI